MSAAEPTEPAGMPARRSMPRSALLAGLGIVVGAIVVLLSSSPTWLRVSLRDSSGQVRLTGRDVASAAVPLALVSAAGLIALLLVRTWARRLLAVVIAAAGVGIGIAAGAVISDPAASARHESKVRVAGQLAKAAVTTAPYLCVAGAVLVVAGALTAGITCGGWPAPARRFERESAAAAGLNAPRGRPTDTWDALEKGEDPTAG